MHWALGPQISHRDAHKTTVKETKSYYASMWLVWLESGGYTTDEDSVEPTRMPENSRGKRQVAVKPTLVERIVAA